MNRRQVFASLLALPAAAAGVAAGIRERPGFQSYRWQWWPRPMTWIDPRVDVTAAEVARPPQTFEQFTRDIAKAFGVELNDLQPAPEYERAGSA